jgi:CheY-like chemotaxis protein
MRRPPVSITILMADDDADDRQMTREALEKSHPGPDLRFVTDGVELLDYLRRRGRFAPPAEAPWPGLILLDLNMPRKNGREVLAELKADPELRRIPVVIMTTSKAEDDISCTYDLGANSYIRKPVTFSGLVEVMRLLDQYWFQIVELPEGRTPP